MTSAGTAAAHRHHDEQAAIAAREVEYLHAVDQEDFGQQDMSGLPWQVLTLGLSANALRSFCIEDCCLTVSAFWNILSDSLAYFVLSALPGGIVSGFLCAGHHPCLHAASFKCDLPPASQAV